MVQDLGPPGPHPSWFYGQECVSAFIVCEKHTLAILDSVSPLKLVVFAGPPLSGKTYLSALTASHYGLEPLAMDEERKNNLPDSEHTKADRNQAYRLMVSKANQRFLSGDLMVILDATFAPAEHRRAVTELAKKWQARIYLVECQVSPEVAVDRFRQRESNHAGIDLTETRVRELADEISAYAGGLVVDTDKQKDADSIASIIGYIDTRLPLWSPDDWVESAKEDQERRERAERKETARGVRARDQTPEIRISPISRRTAKLRIVGYSIIVTPAVALYIYGFILLYWNLVTQATAYLTAGFFVGAIVPVYYLVEKPIRKSIGILQLGKQPRYGAIKWVSRSNRQLYKDYHERTASIPGLPEGFLIDGLPLYFVIPPKLGISFDVVVKPAYRMTGLERLKGFLGTNFQTKCERQCQEQLGRDAAEWGFDWNGYRNWRIREMSSEYFGGQVWEKRVGAASLDTKRKQDGVVEVGGTITSYADYLVAEQSANLEVSGQLPYMREFFEGADWISRNVNLDFLEGGTHSSQRYSMSVSVTALIQTKDNFFIFQRKSPQVQTGAWGLAASTAGGAKWKDVVDRTGNGRSLKNALYREIQEELGLLEKHFNPDETRFIAAAFNLKYGRDLNFYALLRSTLTREQILDIFNRGSTWNSLSSQGQDRWEVANLVFVPLQWLKEENLESFSRMKDILGDARHGRGVIRSLRTYNGWKWLEPPP